MTAGAASTRPDPKSVLSADVYKGDVLAARLRRTTDGVEFRYLDDYLRSARAPVATTLPLTDEPWTLSAGAVPAFFAGLLPEGRRLSNLRRAVKTSADDDLSLLLAVGSDTVGVVRVMPDGTSPGGRRSVIPVRFSENQKIRRCFCGRSSPDSLVDPRAVRVMMAPRRTALTRTGGRSERSAPLQGTRPEFPRQKYGHFREHPARALHLK